MDKQIANLKKQNDGMEASFTAKNVQFTKLHIENIDPDTELKPNPDAPGIYIAVFLVILIIAYTLEIEKLGYKLKSKVLLTGSKDGLKSNNDFIFFPKELKKASISERFFRLCKSGQL